MGRLEKHWLLEMAEVAQLNPAEQASERSLVAVYGCLDRKHSFLVEAGAGAGKTYTLINALQYLIARNQHVLPRRNQKVACITFTNVAKAEIEARTDRSPVIHCDTVHGFCWSLISGFQKVLRERLPELPHWPERIAEVGGDLGQRAIAYELGHRSINDRRISIHHDDVIPLTIALMEREKFRLIIREKYPIILVDEYQDTDAAWIDAIKNHFLGHEGSPQYGNFGDHWQKNYGNGCGRIEHPALTVVGKEANFRSVATVVNCLNRMRPELPQFVVDPDAQGTVHIFHSNNWTGARQTGGHWRGDLPSEAADEALQVVLHRLVENGWDLSPKSTKILMLTHRALAAKQGYPSIPAVFAYNDSFTNKPHPHIAFFDDTLEHACEAYLSRRYGDMFHVLDYQVLPFRTIAD